MREVQQVTDISAAAAQDADRVEALRMIEAARVTTAQPQLEEGLSIKDWMDRMQQAARQSFQHARQGYPQLELEAMADVAAIALGRCEQIIRTIRQDECEHLWEPPVEPATRCTQCGLMYGDA
jgi:predicted transcriptional regulator